MQCTRCGKRIGTDKDPAYQVRIGYCEHVVQTGKEDYDEFLVEEDVGYYCSECLSNGV